MDIFSKAQKYTLVQEAILSGVYPYFYENSSKAGSVATLNGREVFMFGSCNYLGLSNHPDVRLAVLEAVNGYGTCSAGSRLQSGNLDVHVELESKLASYLKKEACLVFTTGYQASVGTISALAHRHDVVLLDRAAHASCVDGARLSHGTVARFRHNDTEHLEALLQEYTRDSGVLVVVDGVYSITGEIAPLREIVVLKQKYEFRLLVDDAHGTGVLGANGRGTAEYLQVEDGVDLLVGSFGKSYGSTGGFAAGRQTVIDFIRHTAAPLVHSTSMTPGDAAAAGAALEVSIREPDRRAWVVDLAQQFRNELRSLPEDISGKLVASPSAIVSLVIGDEMTMLCYWRRLYDEGFYAGPVVPPAVPSGKAVLRISCTADHSKEDLAGAMDAIRRVGSPADAVAAVGLDGATFATLTRQFRSPSARY
jgi:8-amino-7-oxononanoate synthase